MWLVFTAIVVLAAVATGFWYACAVPSSQVFGAALARGPEEGRRITLTFDDGPASPFTEQMLDILRERKIPATFFVCGKNVERFPEVVRRIVAEGHTLGNHTYSHPFLYFRSRASIAEEIDHARAVIQKATGCRPEIFRPPYGVRWFGLTGVLRERGMRLVQWSDTGHDWNRGVEGIIQATLKSLRPGAVILLHDGHKVRPPAEVDRSDTVSALPTIIDRALELGFTFVPIQVFFPHT